MDRTTGNILESRDQGIVVVDMVIVLHFADI